MPGRIILISINRYVQPYPVYPLGVSHVAAALQQSGRTVELLDVNVDDSRIDETIRSFNPDLVGLSLRNIDDVTIDSRKFFVPDLLDSVARVRRTTGAPIVLGGSAYSLFPEQLLDLSGAEFGIVGEGESALDSLLAAILSNADYRTIAGLVCRVEGRTVVNRRLSMTMAAIVPPLRPRRLVDYYSAKSSMLNVQTQRGCSCACCYCTYPLIEGCACRYRAAADVADEFEQVASLGGRYIFVVDSVLNTSNTHVIELCEALIAKKLALRWGCFLRPQGLTAEVMALLARAGLAHIEFGSDSLCDSVLDAYGKNFTFDDILRSSELARENRIRYAHFLIAGGPGESEATLKEGYENSKRLKRTIFFPFVGMRIYPGTALHQIARRENVITEKTDLLSPTFYVSPLVSRSRIDALLAEFQAASKNWIVGEPEPAIQEVMAKLRSIGTEGPLWEFLAR